MRFLLAALFAIIASAAVAFGPVGPWDKSKAIHGVKPDWTDIEDATGLVFSMDLNTIEDASKTERIPKGRIVDVYILAPNRLLYQYRFDCQMSTASALGSGRADPVGPRSVLGGFLAIACNRIRPH